MESLGNPNGILVTHFEYMNDWCALLALTAFRIPIVHLKLLGDENDMKEGCHWVNISFVTHQLFLCGTLYHNKSCN